MVSVRLEPPTNAQAIFATQHRVPGVKEQPFVSMLQIPCCEAMPVYGCFDAGPGVRLLLPAWWAHISLPAERHIADKWPPFRMVAVSVLAHDHRGRLEYSQPHIVCFCHKLAVVARNCHPQPGLIQTFACLRAASSSPGDSRANMVVLTVGEFVTLPLPLPLAYRQTKLSGSVRAGPGRNAFPKCIKSNG